ncbi:MAG: hypothetical protein WA828_02585 [Coleofasciculaceae cyanobacterium]
MKIKLGLGLAVACGLMAGVTPAQAQSGNFSDVTGTIITTSDVVGGFSPGGDRITNLAFRTSAIANAVNNAAVAVNQQLASRNLPIAANGAPTAIPDAVQEAIGCASSGSNAAACVGQIEQGLVNGGANPALARNLALSLDRLTVGGEVDAGRLLALVRAYNGLINNSSAQFLSNPPEELRAVQSVLSILLNAAYGRT